MTSMLTDEAATARPEPPLAGDEIATLIGSLERQRAAIAWKCGDLDEEALVTTLGPSKVTLGGLLKHLALVEDEVFTEALLGRPMPAPWNGVDWDNDPDWEWRTAAEDSAEDLLSLWQSAVIRSRAAVSRALGLGGLDHPADVTVRAGHPSLRRLVVDMIEEYARHLGHADLIRESIDGRTGDDPPSDVAAYPPVH